MVQVCSPTWAHQIPPPPRLQRRGRTVLGISHFTIFSFSCPLTFLFLSMEISLNLPGCIMHILTLCTSNVFPLTLVTHRCWRLETAAGISHSGSPPLQIPLRFWYTFNFILHTLPNMTSRQKMGPALPCLTSINDHTHLPTPRYYGYYLRRYGTMYRSIYLHPYIHTSTRT